MLLLMGKGGDMVAGVCVCVLKMGGTRFPDQAAMHWRSRAASCGGSVP